eukprot:12702970-Heterocapsa_arctica.AAC.1
MLLIKKDKKAIAKTEMLTDVGDNGGGIIALILYLLLLSVGLVGLANLLQKPLIKKAKQVNAKAEHMNK